jgi:hypothetical protein
MLMTNDSRRKQQAAAPASAPAPHDAPDPPIVIPEDMDTDKSTDDGEQLDLPAQAESVKEQGNEKFRKGLYDAAIELYSKAISECCYISLYLC